MILFSYFKVALNSLAFWQFLHQILNLFKNTKCIFFKKITLGEENTQIQEPLGEDLNLLRRLDVLRDRQALSPQAATLLADGRPYQVPRTGRWLHSLTEHWLLGHNEVKGLVTNCLLLEHGHLSPQLWESSVQPTGVNKQSGELRINYLGECPFLFHTADHSHTQAATHGCLLWLLLLNEIRISSLSSMDSQ